VRVSAVALLALVGGCTCAASHTIDASAPDAVAEASADSSTSDSSARDTLPDAECNPVPPYFTSGLCDEEHQAACTDWAEQVWSGEGYVHVVCNITFAGGPVCANGDYCPEPTPSGPPTMCRCAPGLACTSHEVCVSDTADGPRRCVPRCT
jgi:hypothetical protein